MVLVLSSMYSSNNNLTESSDLLNISGKRYNRNTSKTIWSYNPDDATTKKLNSKWRPNSSLQKQTSGLLTGSFTSSQISDISMPTKSNSKSKLSKYFDDNEGSLFSIPQSKISPQQSTSNSRPSSSASSRSSGKKAAVQANIVSTVVLPPDNINKLIEFNTSASRRIREKMQEHEEKEEKKLQRSLSNKIDKQLLFREVTVVRPDSSLTVRSNSNLKKMIDNFNSEQAPIISGKHIDNLTTEIFVALSNGIDKSALLRRSATSVSQSAKEKSTMSSIPTSSLNLNEFYEVDQNKTTEDNFVLKICNEIKNYQPEFKEDSSSKSDATSNKLKSVTILEPKDEIDAQIKRSSKNLIPSDFSQMERLMKGLPIEEKDHFDYGEKIPGTYFDPYFDEGDFSFKYKRVLNDQFEQVIEQYDGNSPVELTLKQSLPLNEYYASLTSSSPQILKKTDNDTKKNRPKSAKYEMNPEYEMYNILKRMMVKKKYEVATIKLEEKNSNKIENDKRKRRCQSSVAPIYSPTTTINGNNNNNNNQTIKIKTRPTSSLSFSASSTNFNGITSTNSLLSKPFAEDDDDEEDENLENKTEDYSIGDPIVRCVKCKKKFVPKTSGRQTPSTLSDKFDLYDEFKISNEAIKKDTWPFELDTNRIIENGNIKKQKKKSETKCYSCNNLQTVPAVIKIPPFETNIELEPLKPKNEDIFRIQIQRSTSSLGKRDKLITDQQYQSQTYTSARRTASAKYLNLNNQELTDNVDKDEFNRLKCSHPKQMTSRELSQYQRKISMIPGKSFSSQRRQSISINRPPLSKIKSDYDKENKISQTYPLIKLSNSSTTGLNNKNNIQQQRPQRQLPPKKQQQQKQIQIQLEQYQQELHKQEQIELEPLESKSLKEDSISKFSSDSVIEKYRENKKSKKFNIDLFSPGATTTLSKLKLYHNEHLDQMNNHKEISAISAFHIYRKASRLINKRPKTAK